MIVYGDALSMSLPGLAHAWYAFEDPDSNRPSPDEKNPGTVPEFFKSENKKTQRFAGF
jgi:hypothetical protein